MRETEATCALCIPWNHKIKGFQIRVDHPVNKRKYIWFTSSGFDGGTSSGSPAGVSGYISPVQRSIHVTEGILKAELASLRSGYPYIGIPGVGNYKSLLPVLADLKSRGLQTVYECMDMDKMMDLTCRCDCMEKCIVCGTPERLLRKQECPQKRRKRDTIRKGCLKLYDMCRKAWVKLPENQLGHGYRRFVARQLQGRG
ncbi:MAG: hypothetical protein ACLS61_05770 [Ruminococcus sp.]